MSRRTVLAALLTGLGVCALPPAGVATTRWAREMAAIDARFEAGVAPGATAFIGSSSIARWHHLARDFPSHRILRHGLNGARIGDIVSRFERLAGRFEPALLVVFAGSNDLVPGRPGTPSDVADGVKALLRASAALRSMPTLLWIEITPTPRRSAVLTDVLEANRRVNQLAVDHPKLLVVEAARQFLDAAGQPDKRFFVDDGLHLNEAGYQIWQDALTRGLHALE